MQVDLVPPPDPVEEVAEATPESEVLEAAPEIVLPDGPVLYMGTRSGSRVSVHPVAEIAPEGLRPLDPDNIPGFEEAFVGRDLQPGTALTLFAEGVRVGTLRVDGVDVEAGFCRPTPVASGAAEFVSGAGAATRFLAVPEGAVADVTYADFQAVNHTYEQRVAGLGLASQALSRTGAIWPPSVLETRADMQAIPLDGDPSGAIAATFMYDDRLSITEPSSPRAYSLMVLGTGGPENYQLEHVWYRPVSEGGKAAARFFEQFDWDGDGQAEILLEVFGANARWAAALDRGPDGWATVFESGCP